MADEPYVPMLPWIVYAIIGANGHGVFWAALGALAVSIALLTAPRRLEVGLPNFLMRGAVLWFAALVVAGVFITEPSSWLQRNALAAAATGFAVIAFTSLLKTPFTEYWTRLGARQRHWIRPSFRRANVFTTMLWGATFAAIAVSTVIASMIDTTAGSTIFNWLVPLALAVGAVLRTRTIWEEFVDDAMDEAVGREALWGVDPQFNEIPPD